jgi:hypothetical protein
MIDDIWDKAVRVSWNYGIRAGYTYRESVSNQMLKLQEELGEAVAAWIGYTGQNLRKGITHESIDVQRELIDVLLTALVALATVSPGADISVINEYIVFKLNRALSHVKNDNSVSG